MEEWRNGGMEEWRNGWIDEYRDGVTALEKSNITRENLLLHCTGVPLQVLSL